MFIKCGKIINPEEIETTCDVCGNKIKGLYNFIKAGDKIVCSDDCLRIAIGQFSHWRNTYSWARKRNRNLKRKGSTTIEEAVEEYLLDQKLGIKDA